MDVPAGAPSPFEKVDYDFNRLPDHDNDFVDEADISAFVKALQATDDPLKSPELGSPSAPQSGQFITALNDWRPIRQRVRDRQPRPKRKKREKPRRGKDETREGFVYTLLKWPLLVFVLTWIICLAAAYAVTRLYIWAYESGVTMRGKRETLRKRLQNAQSFEEWIRAARDMDRYLGNNEWKQDDDYAYYNSDTIRTVRDQLHTLRVQLSNLERSHASDTEKVRSISEELRTLIEASVKNNFVGVENSRLYSETYYGTKNLIQSFLAEVSSSLEFLASTTYLSPQEKSTMFTHLSTNYGRTALCLSGGATFAYYHFGVAKALIDADALPNIITGTSGGALVAALLCTRTNEELKRLLVPSLAGRITACRESLGTTMKRWWSTGAQFDSADWARRCGWFCRGSLTFREAYERTGRILNITCIPSDPHSPAVLANYLTSPDCVIWSAVLASAAVPGILNPVVLMRKDARTGALEPYSFGHKWKDGSLRTDIPLKALNTHFNVTYSIVSQVNPHINLFFFSSRGTVGRPVTHRRGRGWRGGFLGSATEQYLKLDLTKWLKVLRHLELLPRYAEQDWSNIWLQRFDGTITIWPKSRVSDFWHILSDPTPERLARMLWTGLLSCWPKVKFIENRMMVEGKIHEGLQKYVGNVDDMRTRPGVVDQSNGMPSVLSEEDLEGMLDTARKQNGTLKTRARPPQPRTLVPPEAITSAREQSQSPTFGKRLSAWWPKPPTLRHSTSDPRHQKRHSWAPSLQIPSAETAPDASQHNDSRRGSSIFGELSRQATIFADDTEAVSASEEGSESGDASDAEGDIAPLEANGDVKALESESDQLDGEGVGDVIGHQHDDRSRLYGL